MIFKTSGKYIKGQFAFAMKYTDKRVIIVTGHYGSGKTNLAVNLAFEAARQSGRVVLCDLDIVNPYFRAADRAKELEAAGIEVIAPVYAGSNLDIPALPPQIYSVFEDRSRRVILDVGGDDAGAAALGRFASLVLEENDFEHLYVVNGRRALTTTAESAVEVLREIEAAGKVPVTAIVNNTNLGRETDADVVRGSLGFAEKVAELSSRPLLFTAARADVAKKLEGTAVLPVDIYVRTPWDEDGPPSL